MSCAENKPTIHIDLPPNAELTCKGPGSMKVFIPKNPPISLTEVAGKMRFTLAHESFEHAARFTAEALSENLAGDTRGGMSYVGPAKIAGRDAWEFRGLASTSHNKFSEYRIFVVKLTDADRMVILLLGTSNDEGFAAVRRAVLAESIGD